MVYYYNDFIINCGLRKWQQYKNTDLEFLLRIIDYSDNKLFGLKNKLVSDSSLRKIYFLTCNSKKMNCFDSKFRKNQWFRLFYKISLVRYRIIFRTLFCENFKNAYRKSQMYSYKTIFVIFQFCFPNGEF